MQAWQELRAGRTDEALAAMFAEFNRNTRNQSAAIQIGVTYLWLGEWRRAEEHFTAFVARVSGTADVISKFIGTAEWCAGRPGRAIEQWQKGLEAEYTDPSGGVTIPIHLYFAAVTCPDLLSSAEMESLVRRSVSAGNWPDYPRVLANVVLGECSVPDAIQIARNADPNGITKHRWRIAFWNGVHQLASGDRTGFLQQMSKVSNLGWDDFDRSSSDFIDRIWSSEFFLARHHGVDSRQ